MSHPTEGTPAGTTSDLDIIDADYERILARINSYGTAVSAFNSSI
jgi:hypothetical protein